MNSVRQEGVGGAVFARTFISVKRDVILWIIYFHRGCPVECRVEENRSHFCFPFQPGVSKRVTRAAFSDNETEISYAV